MNTKLTQTGPDTCPNHPKANACQTETQANRAGTVRLLQHRCAEGDLTPLGWELHQPGISRYGRGECTDPATLNTLQNSMEQERVAREKEKIESEFAERIVAGGLVTAVILTALAAYGTKLPLFSDLSVATYLIACLGALCLVITAWAYPYWRYKESQIEQLDSGCRKTAKRRPGN